MNTNQDNQENRFPVISEADRMELTAALGLLRGHQYHGSADALERVLRGAGSLAAVQQGVQPDWRAAFKDAVYADLAAADNQDVPLEDYPDRILKVLDSLNHPTQQGLGHDMVSVKKEDANNYCGILSALGMEEEGDPVAEVKRLIAATQQGLDALHQAARDVIAERARQIELGYDHSHDDAHADESIAAAAAVFIMPEECRDWDTSSTTYGDTLAEALLPCDWGAPEFGNDRRAQLVKGAAMAIAEIERLDRAAAQAKQGGV